MFSMYQLEHHFQKLLDILKPKNNIKLIKHLIAYHI